VGKSVLDPVTSHRANVDGTLNVLVAAREQKVKRVVFAGSSSEYGDSPTLPKHEAMPVAPKSPYALQKVMGEEYCRLFTQLYGLETVSIRYFNVFGPRQQPNSPYSGVISLFIKALSHGASPLILGDGQQTRDFTYVANVVDGVLRACSAPDASGQAINVATGGRISLLELLDTLNRIMGTSMAPAFGPARDGDVRDSQASIDKAHRLLGFTPTVGFEEGLRRTVSAAAS
jgi:UDP-glucose 4-epimerase